MRRIEWQSGSAELVDPVSGNRGRFEVKNTVEFVRLFLVEGMSLHHDPEAV
ncbi:hypothetical protein [Glycomyces arizonensis]|uniref:hypothetical protein n=1 Tax=Glycomyces arizonensis TaxID=256035 RepID=UPI00146FA466|nr:hypothetical protein [Glycomyces arizonensis]